MKMSVYFSLSQLQATPTISSPLTTASISLVWNAMQKEQFQDHQIKHSVHRWKAEDYRVITGSQLHTCHSSMLIALSSCTSLVSRCIDWLSGLLRLIAVLWLWWRWICPRCILRLSQSLRNSALRVYCRQNLKAAQTKNRNKNVSWWRFSCSPKWDPNTYIHVFKESPFKQI